jgi:two-component system KDP operon response regulator KdpE
MKQFRVLVVDDEERILNFLSYKLKASGFSVITANNGKAGLELTQAQEPDLVVLDVVMPELDGFETLKQLRSFSSIPVIILSAKESSGDKIKGLSLGADDYLPKPFDPDELIARIEAVRRRLESAAGRTRQEPLSIGKLTIDFDRRSVAMSGEEKSLTRIEWLILSELARNIGRLMLYEELLTRVWGPEYRDDVQLLRTWVSRLRYKLEEDPTNPQLIRNMPKAGYIMDQPSS